MKKFLNPRAVILILSFIALLEALFLVYFWINRPKKILRPPPPPVVIKGKIAIVIDDWGYNLTNLPVLKRSKYPLTIAILPNLKYSKEISEEAGRVGLEAILHLPMEPYEKIRLEKNTILTSMSEATVLNILDKDLSSLPGIKGVSNHMGSKSTEDVKTMKALLSELKKRGLYFLDSLVSANSVGFTLARKMQVPCAKRDIFLDNKDDPLYVRDQLNQLKHRAQLYGYAIGIGHDRSVTLKLLAELMPQMANDGYEFVFLSELIKS